MMKCVVVFLLITISVVGGSFWGKSNQDPNIIIREGHRGVVVEYDKEGEDGNTKISITPPQDHSCSSENCDEEELNFRSGPRELICDTIGKCKHKIADILEKIEEKSKEGASKGVGKVKDTVFETKEGASDMVHKVEDTLAGAKEGASKGVDKVEDTLGQAKDKVEDTLGRAKEGGKQTLGQAKEGGKQILGRAKEGASKGADKVEDTLGGAKEGASKGVHKLKETLGETKEWAKHSLGEKKESASEGIDRAKEALSETKDGSVKKVDKVKEALGEGGGKMKDTIEKVKESDLVDTLKRVVEDMEDNLFSKKEMSKEVEEEGIRKIKDVLLKLEKIDVVDTPKRVAEGIGKNTSKIVERVKQFARKFTNWNRMDSMIRVVHLLGFAMAFGMSMWVTFVSSYILGDALPRHQFGMVQSKLYPVYFKIQAYCIGVVLVTHLLSNWRRVFSSRVEVFHGFSLVTSLVMSLSNLLYWEPLATKIMFKRLKLEKEDGRGRVSSEPVRGTTNNGGVNNGGNSVPARTVRENEVESKNNAMLSEKLQFLNRVSSYANVMTLMSLCLHMVYLGQRI